MRPGIPGRLHFDGLCADNEQQKLALTYNWGHLSWRMSLTDGEGQNVVAQGIDDVLVQ